jgi:radical SAM protein with 4Fe4S-binding SPASM domain
MQRNSADRPNRTAHIGPTPRAKPLSCGSVVRLIRLDPGLPPRVETVEPDAQCDCACLVVEGKDLPALRAPVSFFLEITPSCNNRCAGCGNIFVDRELDPVPSATRPVLPARLWRQILHQIQPFALRLKLTGGEPTLHPEFESIVEQVASLDIPFTLFTNARWRSPQQLLTLLRRLPTLEGLLVSLHGPMGPSHDAFTGVDGSFAETLANVQRATEAGLRVSLSCVLTQYNWYLHDEMLQVARQVRADTVVFNRYLGHQLAGMAVRPDVLRAALGRIEALRRAGEPIKWGNCVPQCFAQTSQSACLAGTAFLTIDPWGRARPCNHSTMICGNLLQEPVEEIWNAPALGRWRQYIPAGCRGCPLFANCGGGCRAQALITGSTFDPLIRLPLLNSKPEPPAEMLLYEHARPLGRFSRRAEEFGSLLLAGNRLFAVGEDLCPLLELLDGQTTLRRIEARWGQPGLALVGNLYQHGLVELVA